MYVYVSIRYLFEVLIYFVRIYGDRSESDSGWMDWLLRSAYTQVVQLQLLPIDLGWTDRKSVV